MARSMTESSARGIWSDYARIECPLLLVAEIQRSGGSMMAQLFDGHPELYAHPFEIHLGYPKKWDWPTLDLNHEPERWFDFLFERKPIRRYVQNGFAKANRNQAAANYRFPFRFSEAIQKEIFLREIEHRPPNNNRAILNAYFTSFFAAWEGYRPSSRKRLVSGFTPRVNMYEHSRAGFLRDYPDGKLISIIRDPITWYASARKHSLKYKHTSYAIKLWCKSTNSSLELARQYPDQIRLLSYEQILTKPQQTLSGLAEFVGIEFHESLLTPTFLGKPVRPNSSFQVDSTGLNRRMLEREQELRRSQVRKIRRLAWPLYERSLEVISAMNG
jgi:hypothetical protein